jgi:hypothetical protein
MVKDLPPYLVYNFDKYDFQPGQGRAWKVISIKKKYLNLTKFNYTKNITTVECIAADGCIMQPLFIFKGERFMEN